VARRSAARAGSGGAEAQHTYGSSTPKGMHDLPTDANIPEQIRMENHVALC